MTTETLTTALIDELAAGRLPWQLLGSFPRETPGERAATEQAVKNLVALLDSCVDAERVEQERRLPPEFFEGIRQGGFLSVQLDPADGGLGLSDYGTARLLVAAMQRCTVAGYVLSIHNGIGLPSLLPLVGTGRLRELILNRLAQGAFSGWADTEPTGAANTLSATIAEPMADGGYRLTGQKAFIGNGTIAGELVVSACVPVRPGSAERPDACLFLVDTRSPGFRVRAEHELLGLKGMPLGTVELTGVEVPPERVLEGPGGHWRDVQLVDALASRGRIYLLTAPALAIARRCVQFQREFAGQRVIDGRRLSDYPAIRRLMAASLADLYAIDSLMRWGMLGDGALLSRNRDRFATKNLATRACWRIVERTMSLLAAAGLETEASQQLRGVVPRPVERLWRDARVLRIAGAVDFAIDLWSGEGISARHSAVGPAPEPAADPRLSPANAGHLGRVAADSHRLATAVAALVRRNPDRQLLLERQPALIAAGRVASELLGMSVTLARAADAESAQRQQRLADGYCAAAARRLAACWPDLEQPDLEQPESQAMGGGRCRPAGSRAPMARRVLGGRVLVTARLSRRR